MKTQCKLAAFAFAALLTGLTAHAQKQNITPAQLPASAQTFLNSNFEGQSIRGTWKDKEIFDTDYKVMLTNDTEIEFDEKGNWDEIDGNGKAIPATVLPKAIATYIATTYEGQSATQIDKKHQGYEVELSNGVELEFNAAGKFIKAND